VWYKRLYLNQLKSNKKFWGRDQSKRKKTQHQQEKPRGEKAIACVKE